MAKKIDGIKPFSKIPLIRYFQHDLEKIKMSYRLSDSIRTDLKNIRAAGDEVELSVKHFFQNKLFPKYHVCDGHIVDSTLKVSPQYDILICENSKNPILFNLADKSELIYFETVYCFGEVKRSFYSKDIIQDFSDSIKRTKSELHREIIAPNYIEASNGGFYVEEPLTNLPLRNPLLTFLFFVNTSTSNFKDFSSVFSENENVNLPNFIVLLDAGIIVNVNKEQFEKGRLSINLYPEFATGENIWVLMDLCEENSVLTYQYMLILEHLNNSIVSSPDLRKYTNHLFDFSITNVHKL
jgi:hypothetical protein